MEEKRTSIFDNVLIWAGAAVGLAEILSGTYLAPLGMKKGLLTIFIGHAIGCVLLFLAGYIGGKTRKSAMETVTLSFGNKGAFLFAFMNVLQLIGWTSIMIYDGALAANSIFGAGHWVWALVIGVLIILWIMIGIKSLGKVNLFAVGSLFILTIILSVVIFGKDGGGTSISETMSFGAAIELSVAMPLSWVPLISDYTREAKRPVAAAAWSSVAYGLMSCWMYIIGMGAAILAGTSDIAEIMLKAGLGIAGLAIVVLATVTTTFLDAYSAGVSSELFSKKIKGKYVAVGAAVAGTVAAIAFNMDNITGFLYLIGSVFAPMISIMIVDYFFLKENHEDRTVNWESLLVWLAGFLLYRKMMNVDLPIGSTLACMAATMVLCLVVGLVRRALSSKYGKGSET